MGAMVSRLAIALVLVSSACTANDDGGSAPSTDAGSGGGGVGGTGPTSGQGGAGGAGGASGTGGAAAMGGTGGTGGVTESGGSGGSSHDDAGLEDASVANDGGLDGEVDGGVGPLPDQSCLEGIADYVAAGPFSFETATLGYVKVWIPQVPETCKLPVVHFANGTGAHCSTYLGALEHLASHGFFTACYDSGITGQGTQCIEAVETVYAEYPQLVSTQQIGFSGNGTGGASALICTTRAERKWGNTKILAAHALPPDLAGAAGDWMELYNQIDSPTFIVNGSVDGQPTDGLVPESWVRDAYEAFNPDVEAYWYEGVGAEHIPIPMSFIEESTVAWFRWKLLGDAAACAYVKAMPDSERWNLQEQQNAVDCD